MNYNEKVFFCIVICTFLLLFAYILYLCFKQIKRYKDIIFELNDRIESTHSEINKHALKCIEKDNEIKELNHTIAEKNTEIDAIVKSNLAATDKIRNFYFVHSGKQLKGANVNPKRMEIYITDVLFHLSCQLSKSDTTFDKIILKNKTIAGWYEVFLDEFTHKVYMDYLSKGYEVNYFNDDNNILDNGLEKYLLAENDIHILLIQCTYLELKYTLNPESIYALHSTYFRLQKNTNKKLFPVLICSSGISDESKHLLQSININFRENAFPEIHQTN